MIQVFVSRSVYWDVEAGMGITLWHTLLIVVHSDSNVYHVEALHNFALVGLCLEVQLHVIDANATDHYGTECSLTAVRLVFFIL